MGVVANQIDNISVGYVSNVVNGYYIFLKDNKRYWKFDPMRVSRINWLINILKPQKNEVILEVGCGFGPLLFQCVKKQTECICIGIDIIQEQISATKKFFEQHQLSNRVKFFLSDGKKLPFKSDSIDKIILIDVLEHMDDNCKILVLKECFRVLRMAGMLLINTPNLNYLRFSLEIKRIINLLTFRNYSEADISFTPTSKIKGDHIGLTNTFFLKKILKDNGFSNVKLLHKPDNILGKLLTPFFVFSGYLKDFFIQSITLRCLKNNI